MKPIAISPKPIGWTTRIGLLRTVLEHQIDLGDVDAVGVARPGREAVERIGGVDRIDPARLGAVNHLGRLRSVVARHCVLEGERRGKHGLAAHGGRQRQHRAVGVEFRRAATMSGRHRPRPARRPARAARRWPEIRSPAHRRASCRSGLAAASRPAGHSRQGQARAGTGLRTAVSRTHDPRGRGRVAAPGLRAGGHALRSQRRSGVCCQ